MSEKQFRAKGGDVSRAAAELHLGDHVVDVLVLVDAAGRGTPAAFTTTLRADGRDYSAGDWAPASIRDGVLESCLRLGRVETVQPPEAAVLVPLTADQVRARKAQAESGERRAESRAEVSAETKGAAPAWTAQPVEQLFRTAVVKKLQKAGIATAGDLDRYGDEHKGLEGLELTDKESQTVCDVMAELVKGEPPPPEGDEKS